MTVTQWIARVRRWKASRRHDRYVRDHTTFERLNRKHQQAYQRWLWRTNNELARKLDEQERWEWD